MGGRVVAEHEGVAVGENAPSVIDGGTSAIRRSRLTRSLWSLARGPLDSTTRWSRISSATLASWPAAAPPA
jgi:hypothetical protein